MTTFDTPTPITATFEISIGDVHVTASDRTNTTVDVQPADPLNDDDCAAAERVRVEYLNNHLAIKTPKQLTWKGERGRVDITIELPAASHLNGSMGIGDLYGNGPIGECRVKNGIGNIHLELVELLDAKTGQGEIHLDHATGQVDVKTGSGDVRLRELDGTSTIKNSNGETWIGTAHGQLRVQAANGRISIDTTHADVSAKSANGAVRINNVVRGSVEVESKLGSLEIGIPEGTAAWIDAQSNLGRVKNELEQSDVPAAAAETAEVRARTSLGQILIRRPNRATVDAV